MRFLLTSALCLCASLAYAGETGHAHDAHSHDTHADAHDDHDHGHDDASAHKAVLGDVVLLHAWTPETEGPDALVYVEIDNGGDQAVTLLGAESALASGAELVGFQLQNGAPSYVALPMLPIAAGAEMMLAPRAAAIRLSGLTDHLHEGDAFELHIQFNTGEVPMMVQVEPAGATQHSHAGHNH